MYPFIRLAKTFLTAGRATPLDILGVHVSHHRCWPQDLDMFMEMNNGRVLTIFDLGRFGLAARTGLTALLRREKWGLAVAGGSTRYRKRILPFARFEMRTRCAGWDARFFYMEQTIWLGNTCAAQTLLRTCVTDKAGIVPSDRALAALGSDVASPELPAWVQNWITAEDTRVWPPQDVRS